MSPEPDPDKVRAALARDVWQLVDTTFARIQLRAARAGIALEDLPGVLGGLEAAAESAVGPRPASRPAPGMLPQT